MLPMPITSSQLDLFIHWQLELATANTTTLAK